MNSKPKSIDMGSLIQKVTKRARELLKKKSKPQTKGKSANGTSRYSKSKRQKLLIGGVSVNIDDKKKEDILNIIGIKTQQRTSGQAHLVELLKLKTIQKIESALLEYNIELRNDKNRVNLLYTIEESARVARMEDILKDVGSALKLSSTQEIEDFQQKQNKLEEFYKKDTIISDKELKDRELDIYSYNVFTGNLENYKECKIDKELTALNIFKMFYDLTTMEKDKKDGMDGGAFNNLFKYTLDSNGQPIGGPILRVNAGDSIIERIEGYEKLLEETKKAIKDIRAEFQVAGLVLEKEKKGKNSTNPDEGDDEGTDEAYLQDYNTLYDTTIATRVNTQESEETLLGNKLKNVITSLENRQKFNNLLNEIVNGGKHKKIEAPARDGIFKGKKGYTWVENGDNPFYIYTLKYNETSSYKVELQIDDSSNRKELIKLRKLIISINKSLASLLVAYRQDYDTDEYYTQIEKDIKDIYSNYCLLSVKHPEFKPDKFVGKQTDASLVSKRSLEGGNPVKYKSTGQVVHIMFQNKKYKRVIYVKEKRNTKYCKMNNEYILLSKLKVIE